MKAQLRHRSDYQRMRWRNNGGWTTEIARAPIEGDSFDWRVSIADVEQDGEFSPFDGYDRSIVLLEGHGMELRFDGAAPVLLNRRGQVHGFRGESRTRCRLLDGATRDFNVFTARRSHDHQVLFRPLVGPMVLFPEVGVSWLVHVVSGQAQQQHQAAAPIAHAGDTFLAEPDGTGRQMVLTGGGELLLVRIARRAEAV